MKNVTLYRGISVSQSDSTSIIDTIKHNGLNITPDASWNGGFIWKDQTNSTDLFHKKDLSRNDTGIASEKTKDGQFIKFIEGYKSICFADECGATYYAKKHNYNQEKPISLLIEADLDLSAVAIDGRDFLYSAFSFLRTLQPGKIPKAKDHLSSAFGEKILLYVDKVLQHKQSDTNAICDLIICDDEIKIAHSKNEQIINGRHGTHFKCAFFVKVPIPAENIKSISVLTTDYQLPSPSFSLADFR